MTITFNNVAAGSSQVALDVEVLTSMIKAAKYSPKTQALMNACDVRKITKGEKENWDSRGVISANSIVRAEFGKVLDQEELPTKRQVGTLQHFYLSAGVNIQGESLVNYNQHAELAMALMEGKERRYQQVIIDALRTHTYSSGNTINYSGTGQELGWDPHIKAMLADKMDSSAEEENWAFVIEKNQFNHLLDEQDQLLAQTGMQWDENKILSFSGGKVKVIAIPSMPEGGLTQSAGNLQGYFFGAGGVGLLDGYLIVRSGYDFQRSRDVYNLHFAVSTLMDIDYRAIEAKKVISAA